MKQEYAFSIRPTGILIEDGKLLLVRQRLKRGREWSLPGGRLERGDSLGQGLIRRIEEGFPDAGSSMGGKANIGLDG